MSRELASSFADLEREAAHLLTSVKMDVRMAEFSRRGREIEDRLTSGTPSSATSSDRTRSPDSDGRPEASFSPSRRAANDEISQQRVAIRVNSSSSGGRSPAGPTAGQPLSQSNASATVVPEKETKRALKKLAHHWGRHANSFGYCIACGEEIIGAENGCEALGKVYHSSCFTCSRCGESLSGQTFYILKDRVVCERDYMKTLEKCYKCGEPVADKVIRALGELFHPKCFVCSVCGQCLDGIPFTVDATNNVYCVKDFNYKYAPKCGVCDQPIIQDNDSKENLRIVAMDKSFHPKCYKCEDCGKNLTEQGEGCYPLDTHLLCRDCNSERIQSLTSTLL